jgi:hypothetical protein
MVAEPLFKNRFALVKLAIYAPAPPYLTLTLFQRAFAA